MKIYVNKLDLTKNLTHGVPIAFPNRKFSRKAVRIEGEFNGGWVAVGQSLDNYATTYVVLTQPGTVELSPYALVGIAQFYPQGRRGKNVFATYLWDPEAALNAVGGQIAETPANDEDQLLLPLIQQDT